MEKRFKMICRICGEEFVGTGPNHRYCGNECRKIARRRSRKEAYDRDKQKRTGGRNLYRCRDCGGLFEVDGERLTVRRVCNTCILSHRHGADILRYRVHDEKRVEEELA